MEDYYVWNIEVARPSRVFPTREVRLMKKKIKQPYKREINKLLKAFSRGRAKDVLDILVHMAILVPVIPITSQEMEYACSLLEDGKEEESV